MAKVKGRAKDFEDLDEHITKDHDPEANVDVSEHGSDSEASEDENAGTEHYVSVGKSKLRQKEGVSLGPKYQGSRVSRAALEQESESADEEDEDEDEDEDDQEFDDPETADLERDEAEANDSEISSDNALGESDEEHLQDFIFRGSSKPKKPVSKSKRATAADFMSSSDEGGADVDEDEDEMSGVELEGSDSEEDELDDGLDALINGAGDSDDESEEDDDEDDEDEEASDNEEDSDDEDDKETKAKSVKPVMAAFSNRTDVSKGLAIREQRKIYDGLLNLRIRLQKALIAANTFAALEDSPEPESEPYEAAEEAAIKLLNTISSLKDNFGSSRAGDKRKRELDASMTTQEIWEQMQAEEERAVKVREAGLDKWSRKVQSVDVTRGDALKSRKETLVTSLQEQLLNPDNRLAKRSRVPRSCAPAQAAKGVTQDDDVYDDADFYQVLLKELVDQRTVDGSSASAGAVPTVVLTAAKEVKTRKNVDRKASKGRKMRFTVHEKLQNFMAPEDRRAWEQGAIDRFFGTLFGRKMELNEDESDDDMEVDAEEAGLRLFRN
ncbi:rRNA-processing protein bfr2 [Fusarium piperis]|uniref:Protein BFR2 n=1 Tax=Fusarium piperis TaxID=1435070 RepID=A0A9W9BKK0_9HYPO|nr:rRNA-processing protein bfr2 [Fusarium piperis]